MTEETFTLELTESEVDTMLESLRVALRSHLTHANNLQHVSPRYSEEFQAQAFRTENLIEAIELGRGGA